MPSETELTAKPGDFEADDLPAFPHRALYDLWLAKSPPGGLPRRSAFNPAEMPRLLPYLTVFDVTRNPMRFHIRLVGTAVVDAMGKDTTGQWLDELDNVRDVQRRAESMAYTGTPYYLSGMPVTWTHRTYKRYSVLGLPLAEDGNTVDKLFYAMLFE